MLLAMALAAMLCILIGVQPQLLYALLPWEVDYWPYDTTHVLAQLQLLFFAALAFVWMEKKGYAPAELPGVNIDAEWLYRKLLPAVVSLVRRTIRPLVDTLGIFRGCCRDTSRGLYSRASLATFHLAASWPTGSMVLWISSSSR